MTFERRFMVSSVLGLLMCAGCALLSKKEEVLEKVEPIINDSIEVLTCAKTLLEMAHATNRNLPHADALKFCRAYDAAPLLIPSGGQS